MKAIVIEGPHRAILRDIALDHLPAAQVRVQVLATGVCGTDVELLEGSMPYLTSGQAKYPFIPGHEWVGEVSDVGADVTGFAVGDRVVGECSCGCMRCERCQMGQYHRCASRTETGVLNRPGAFAEYIDFPALFLHRVSKDIPVESACLIEPAAVAFNGVRRAAVSPQDDVAILGDGPVGLLLLMMAKVFGARSLTLIGASAERLAMARKLGADAIVNVREESAVAALAHGNRGTLYSVVIEATGNPHAIHDAANVVAPGGRIILQGIFAGQKLDGLELDRIVVNEVTIQGVLGSPAVWPDVIRLIESGRIDPGVLVTDELGLVDYLSAIDRVKRRRGIKTIVRTAA